MKKSIIARIIIWSIIACILTGFLIAGLTYRGWNFGSFFRIDDGNYTYGGTEFDPAEIDSVEIEWISGDITIQEGTKVSFSEHSTSQLDEDEQMGYRIEGKTLIIKAYTRSQWWGFSTPNKDLALTLPPELMKLDIEVVSADVNMSGNFTINQLSLEGVSGSWRMGDMICENVDMETVSGKIALTFSEMPHSINFDSVSGDIQLYVPKDAGFRINLDSVSGDVISDMPMVKEKKDYVIGDGSTRVDGDTVSGDIEVYGRP